MRPRPTDDLPPDERERRVAQAEARAARCRDLWTGRRARPRRPLTDLLELDAGERAALLALALELAERPHDLDLGARLAELPELTRRAVASEAEGRARCARRRELRAERAERDLVGAGGRHG